MAHEINFDFGLAHCRHLTHVDWFRLRGYLSEGSACDREPNIAPLPIVIAGADQLLFGLTLRSSSWAVLSQ
ncbi:hypothetical protein [Roseibium sp.]|uniref:hypothetical protein n=1 Tax=Roseibium sp. TaxID=1936156 RepID=UPI003BA84CF9